MKKRKLSQDKDLSVKIETTRGTWDTVFPKTTNVADVLQAVITHFGFAASGKYELRLASDPNNALKPERPLVSYGVNDNDVLVFTDLGIAV